MKRSVPNWVPDAIFYQIFPDRFRRHTGPWPSDPAAPADRRVQGGTLAGIQQSIPYLLNLGITAIYLTPIFRAESYHKYDTIDYFAVDPCFGTDQEFRSLIASLHDQGIRIILDGVFNHCSQHHPFFQDVIAQGQASTYWDWFTVHGDDVTFDPEPNYACWAGVGNMPEWNHDNPDTVAYLLDIVRHWIEAYGIDGWRLDTTEYLPPDFVREIYRTCREISPDIYVLGEVMGLGTPWFRHQALDGVMHYKFLEAMTDFFAKGAWDARRFWHSLRAHWFSYPEDGNFGSYTLVSSHDRPRFLTLCGNDVNRLQLAIAFQFAFPGPPAIYYGDEIGLQGGDDPDNRRCFPWDDSLWNHQLLSDVQQLSRLRRESSALRRGAVKALVTESRLLVLERSLDDQRFVIAFNAAQNASAQFILPEGNWINALGGKDERGDQWIPALSYRFYQQET